MGVEKRLNELGIELPAPVQPLGPSYAGSNRQSALYLRNGPGDETMRGKLGSTMSVDKGYAAAAGVVCGYWRLPGLRFAIWIASPGSSRCSVWLTHP